MPPRYQVARAWGTRFDQLVALPPSRKDTPVKDGNDEKNATATLQSNAAEPADATSQSPSKATPRDERLPHDASIFVGSLPPTVEQSELSRLLNEHLSSYTEIRSIKVIRDSKGGTCAFVQCETGALATQLLQSLHESPPSPLLGRYLRFERARAFRTLLLSYRKPTRYIAPPDETEGADHGKVVEIEAASAMKLWRAPGSKYTSVLYNEEARDNSESAQFDQDDLQRISLLLDPLTFDEATIEKVVRAFGPLEDFHVYNVSPVATGDVTQPYSNPMYPPPHNGPRGEGMDDRCWEVKWGHRDDAVNALTALRRVPHLTVTWAHQPGVHNQHSPLLPSERNPHGSHMLPIRHTQGRGPYRDRAPAETTLPSRTVPAARDAFRGPVSHGLGIRDTSPSKASFMAVRNPDFEGDIEAWQLLADTSDNPSSPAVKSTVSLRSHTWDGDFGAEQETPLDWTDADFPPLVEKKGKEPANCAGKWVDRTPIQVGRDDAAHSPLSVATTLPAPDTTEDVDSWERPSVDELGRDAPKNPATTLSPFTPTTADFISASPTSPIVSVGHQGSRRRGSHSHGNARPLFVDPYEKDVDPNSIFVGRLDMYGPDPWDEGHLKGLFEQYGKIEDVKVVKPLTAKSAFAFVKFDNPESTILAVRGEHNKIYRGRQMRVQMRDCNHTSKPLWRHYGRGQGRLSAQERASKSPQVQPTDIASPEQSPQPPRSMIQSESVVLDTLESVPVVASLSREAHRNNSLGESPETSQVRHELLEDSQAAAPGDATDLRREVSSSYSGFQESPSDTVVNVPDSPKSQGWIHEPPPVPLTPATSSVGSSVSAHMPFLPTMPMAYYPPPWAQHIPAQYSYPQQFGYPGYTMPVQQPMPQFSNPSSSGASSPAPFSPHSWPINATYTPYIPNGFNLAMRSAHPEQPQVAQAHPPNLHAPLVPTGFIQNEQGTLIPVYQPDALSSYMSGMHHPVASGNDAQPSIVPWQSLHQRAAYPFPHATHGPGVPSTELQPNFGPTPPASWLSSPYRLGYAPVPQSQAQVQAVSPISPVAPTTNRQPPSRNQQGPRPSQQRTLNNDVLPQMGRRHGRRGLSLDNQVSRGNSSQAGYGGEALLPEQGHVSLDAILHPGPGRSSAPPPPYAMPGVVEQWVQHAV